MRQPVSSSRHTQQPQCPKQRIRIRLPLATVEELDYLARLAHTSRQQILRQLISAALVSDTPLRPNGPDPSNRLRTHAELTHARSLELDRGSAEG
jgi:hypothetical protein